MTAKPIYSLEDVENIDIWSREIDILKCATELDLKLQGLAIYLSWPCKIHQACVDKHP